MLARGQKRKRMQRRHNLTENTVHLCQRDLTVYYRKFFIRKVVLYTNSYFHSLTVSIKKFLKINLFEHFAHLDKQISLYDNILLTLTSILLLRCCQRLLKILSILSPPIVNYYNMSLAHSQQIPHLEESP